MDFDTDTLVPGTRAQEVAALEGERVAFLGRLSSMTREEAGELVRGHGGTPLRKADATATMIVVGDEAAVDFKDRLVHASVLDESDFWRRLGLLESCSQVRGLYTTAMLASIIGVPRQIVSRWRQKGWLAPAREIRRLVFYDFASLSSAKALATLFRKGVSSKSIEQQLEGLRRFSMDDAPFDALAVAVDGARVLLRQANGVLDSDGQFRLAFPEREVDEAHQTDEVPRADDEILLPLPTPHESEAVDSADLLERAADMEDRGEIATAIDLYHGWLTWEGASAEICFRLAELLYLTGDLTAARERYFMAVELDEEFVEARVNLGCVLAELGDADLAIAAIRGALSVFPDYADAHYHLARLLDDSRNANEAETHWRHFLRLAPNTPWADEAQRRLGIRTIQDC
jgi:tetratricopeptide (TPR) repeat protein